MNMFKPTKAKSVSEYIGSLPPERKKDMLFIHNFIRKTVPKLKSHFAYNMLGYGKFPYKNARKEMVSWPVVSLASQKNYISLYVCSVDKGKYVAEKYEKKLGKVSVGRSCIRFKRVEDVDLGALKMVLKEAEKNPGLVK